MSDIATALQRMQLALVRAAAEPWIVSPREEKEAIDRATKTFGGRTDRIRVYVAGPYSGDTEFNTATAIDCGQDLLDQGFAPLVPHLTHYWHTQRYENPWETWLELDLPWVARADCVYRLPGESRGTDIEVGYARGLGIPVYTSFSELVEHPPVKGHPGFHDFLRKIGDLHDSKQVGYGSQEDPFANMRASSMWGIRPWVGALVRLCDKVKRLQNFAKLGHLPHESAYDNLEDIAVYAGLSWNLLKEEEKQ